MRAALAPAMALSACVADQADTRPAAGETIVIDGVTMQVRQEYDWPSMIAPVSAETGETVIVQSGTEDTVIVSGSPDSRDRAIRALAQFCNEEIDPVRFDTQFVYRDPATGDWW
ncbi:MAG: hypothetical protein N2439_05065, partial [Anaerolineae bacterium]|nr:hypothetical protein [Anaerolineae bacterium]